MIVEPDGKIVLVGGVAIGTDNQCGIARFNANGTLDATFGDGGYVMESAVAGCSDVARQPDGKLVITAQERIEDVYYATFLRLLPTGALDSSFGTDGALDISSYDKPTRVTVESSGNLLTGLVIQDPTDGALKSYVIELASPAAGETLRTRSQRTTTSSTH